MESLALTVEEVMDVRRVLVKAEMEKFLHNPELLSSLKKGKVRPHPLLLAHSASGVLRTPSPNPTRSVGPWWALARRFLTGLLLLPSQVPPVLLASHLSLLQEVSLLSMPWPQVYQKRR